MRASDALVDCWLPLDVVEAHLALASERGVSEVARAPGGFVDAFRGAEGDPDRLPEWWRRRRDAFVARHLTQMVEHERPFYEVRKGRRQPTRQHLALIVWAWQIPMIGATRYS